MISLIINLITIAIVAVFVFVVYMAYRGRPSPSIRPIDVMRDMVAGQSGHARIYKVAPWWTQLEGDTGSFEANDSGEYSDLQGNLYDYIEGQKPWDTELISSVQL